MSGECSGLHSSEDSRNPLNYLGYRWHGALYYRWWGAWNPWISAYIMKQWLRVTMVSLIETTQTVTHRPMTHIASPPRSNSRRHEDRLGAVFSVLVLTVASWWVICFHIPWNLKNVELIDWICVWYLLHWMLKWFEPVSFVCYGRRDFHNTRNGISVPFVWHTLS